MWGEGHNVLPENVGDLLMKFARPNPNGTNPVPQQANPMWSRVIAYGAFIFALSVFYGGLLSIAQPSTFLHTSESLAHK